MCVPASAEAMMVAFWDNMYTRVQWQADVKEQDEEAKLDMKADEQQGKYTDSKAGQNPYKGWTDAGIKFFKDCLDLAKEGRNSPGCAAFERAVLDAVRQKRGITAQTPEELHGEKKKKSTKAPIDESKILDLFDSDAE